MSFGQSITVTIPRGGWWYAAVDIPANAGRLYVGTTGDNGDADLYLRRQQASGWEQRATSRTSYEALMLVPPVQGRYLIGVYASRQVSNLTVRVDGGADWSLPGVTIDRWRWERRADGTYDMRVWLRNYSSREFQFDDFVNVTIDGSLVPVYANLVDPVIRPGQTYEMTVGFYPQFRARRGQRVTVGFDVLAYDQGVSRLIARYRPWTARLP